MDLKYNTTTTGDILILEVEGNLDAITAPEIRHVIETIVNADWKKVIVDMSKLNLIDSSGVGAIVSLYKRIRLKKGDVKIAGISGQPKEIFRLLGLDKAFDLVINTEEGIKRFK